MLRSDIVAAIVAALIGTSLATTYAQTTEKSPASATNWNWENAKWVWFPADGNPLEKAPAETVWFRTVVRGNEPSTGAIRIACDDHFVLWVNGHRVGEGGAQKPSRFNLNGIVERGPNVIAIEATNKEGRAGLFVDGEIRGQSGKTIPFDTPADWKATLAKPGTDAWLGAKFDDSTWKPVRELTTHQDSPWKQLAFSGTYLDRFDVAPGFELKRIAEPELVGSLVCISWGNRGRLLASRERGPILNLIDEDRDGTFDKVTEFSSRLKNCQGLCMIGDDLIAVGDGPQGTGIYRLPDTNHDDVADSEELLIQPKGKMGEHGPHNIVFGPDGWLYHNLGNHAWITTMPEQTAPCRNYVEGNLHEPAFEDANGHAVGIKAPGGTIWRFSPDGKKWWLETMGFRNHYDIAFNSKGDLFTFDSDMEWDVNLPWYRPVRINHCVPGGEFGWRSGAKLWPEYYFDSLPATVNIGRGSPTGVLFYEHTQFPEKYRGAMLNCDWSMGRLIVTYLKKEGASYTGAWDNLVTGNPLNISDVEVDRDGTVIFSTGGRNTEGGIYRITHTATQPLTIAAPKSIEEILALPQGQSAWARELIRGAKADLGANWESSMLDKLANGSPSQKIRALSILAQQGPKPSQATLLAAATDADPGVRSFATWLLADHPTSESTAALTRLLEDSDAIVQRRACEAFVRSGLEAPVEPLLKLLGNEDRWLRFAARLALERVPAGKWKTRGLVSTNGPDILHNVVLALLRSNPEHVTLDEIDTAMRDSSFKSSPASDDIKVRQGRDMIRIAELMAIHFPDTWPEKLRGGLGQEMARLLRMKIASEKQLPGLIQTLLKDESFLREVARLVAFSQTPDAAEVLTGLLEQSKDPQAQVHYAMCLRYVKDGWNADLNRRFFDWYETTREMEGGHSLQGYLRNIASGILEHFTPEDRAALLADWKKRPHAARLLLSVTEPGRIKDFDQAIEKLLTDLEQIKDPALDEMASAVINSLAKSSNPLAQATLRKLFDQQPDRRDQLGRSLATKPSVENAPYYVRALQAGDSTTQQQCLQALNRSNVKTDKAEDYRAVIVAGLKLGRAGGALAVQVLKNWTGKTPARGANVSQALTEYQTWYAEKFPNAPAAELSVEDLEKSKFSLQQLLEIVERGPPGDVARGKAVFTKATCIKCHRFVKDGESVGPDLTTVRRRFQKKEILESVLFPSQVISDQYRAVTVSTSDGLIYTGMPIASAGTEKQLTLLLSDATKVVVAKDKIEDQFPARLSVMPEGLFKTLSEQEIADLFAFLETSRSNPEPSPTPPAK